MDHLLSINTKRLQNTHNNHRYLQPKVFDLLHSSERHTVGTGLVAVDKTLLGGLHGGTITELAGPSGCGKTQLCCQLSAIASVPTYAQGLEAGVLYVDTESAVSATRILEIASTRFPELSGKDLSDSVSRIYVYTVSTTDNLLQLLTQTIQGLIIENNIKLVIIDSVASLIRKEFDSQFSSKSEILLRQASLLKDIAEGFNIPVVVVNQVHTLVAAAAAQSSEKGRQQKLELKEMTADREGYNVGQIAVALGNTWYHAVNTRLTLHYKDNVTRQLTISKSPLAAVSSFDYIINEKGLVLKPVSAGRGLEGLEDSHSDREDNCMQSIRCRDTCV